MLKPPTSRNNYQPALIEFLEEPKRVRLGVQRRQTTLARVNSFLVAISNMLPCKPGVPSPFDVALHSPMVREIIEQPVETEVTQTSFEPIRHLLPAFVVQWQQDAKAYLSDLVRASVDLSPNADPLSLVVGTYFKCDHCRFAWFTYEEIFRHYCKNQSISMLLQGEDPLKAALLRECISGYTWQRRGGTVQLIAKLFGEDPTRVTAEELDESPFDSHARHATEFFLLQALLMCLDGDKSVSTYVRSP